MTSPLLLLAEKVEGLFGLDRRIDAEIAHAVGDAQMRDGTLYAWCEAGSTTERVRAALYTSSVDTAMWLVPHGCVLHALGQSQSPSDEMRPWLAMVVQRDASLSTGRTSYAATPALALVAASLRARAAMEAGE